MWGDTIRLIMWIVIVVGINIISYQLDIIIELLRAAQ